MQEYRQERRARRVRTGASCAAVTAEYGLNLFVTRQVAPGGAFFDHSPFFFGDVIAVALLLELAGEARNLLLIGRRPSQHAIENFLNLLFGHDEDIANQPPTCHGAIVRPEI